MFELQHKVNVLNLLDDQALLSFVVLANTLTSKGTKNDDTLQRRLKRTLKLEDRSLVKLMEIGIKCTHSCDQSSLAFLCCRDLKRYDPWILRILIKCLKKIVPIDSAVSKKKVALFEIVLKELGEGSPKSSKSASSRHLVNRSRL